MAPLSILPGRIRFQAPELRAREAACHRFEAKMAGMDGVLEVSANFRTGRVLIRFDEHLLNRNQVSDRIVEALASAETQDDSEGDALLRHLRPAGKKPAKGPSGMGRHVLREALTHALLPSPLDLLLPTAVAVLKK